MANWFLELASFLLFALSAIGTEGCTDGTVCKLSKNNLKWFSFGDWGGMPVWPYRTLAQTTVATTLSSMGAEVGTDFQLSLGDNFYFTGVSDVDDSRFRKTFENVYTGAPLQKPWYFLAGNHDHYGNVSAQIAYSKKSRRWHYPNLYYTIKYQLGDGTTVDFIVIDTIQLCGNTRDLTFTNALEYLRSRSFDPQGPENLTLANAQLAWIENQLQNSQATYLFVAGHYPVWSLGEHGPTTCLVRQLKPLLHKYKVSAYLAGHDHDLQHIRNEEDGAWVSYFISGAGGFIDDSTKHKNDIPTNSLRYNYPEGASILGKLGVSRGGFLLASLNATAAEFSFKRGDGKHLYRYAIGPRE